MMNMIGRLSLGAFVAFIFIWAFLASDPVVYNFTSAPNTAKISTTQSGDTQTSNALPPLQYSSTLHDPHVADRLNIDGGVVNAQSMAGRKIRGADGQVFGTIRGVVVAPEGIYAVVRIPSKDEKEPRDIALAWQALKFFSNLVDLQSPEATNERLGQLPDVNISLSPNAEIALREAHAPKIAHINKDDPEFVRSVEKMLREREDPKAPRTLDENGNFIAPPAQASVLPDAKP